MAICACPTDINLPKAINKDTLVNFRELVSNITKYSIIEDYNVDTDGDIIACGVYGLSSFSNIIFVLFFNK